MGEFCFDAIYLGSDSLHLTITQVIFYGPYLAMAYGGLPFPETDCPVPDVYI